jgi:O-methyltransferase
MNGLDWPSDAETMIGMKRLDNVQACVTDALRRGVPGDLVEAGVWRGGVAILMRAVLAAYDDPARRVWLADSFRGLPEPDPEHYPADSGDRHWELTPYLGIPLDVVQNNFRRYGLLDDRVRFLPGWFRDTLPSAPINAIAVLRIDGDMYESTFEALSALYPKVSPDGYVIVDDYGGLPNCKAAVCDFRNQHGVREEIVAVDWTGVYWRKANGC